MVQRFGSLFPPYSGWKGKFRLFGKWRSSSTKFWNSYLRNQKKLTEGAADDVILDTVGWDLKKRKSFSMCKKSLGNDLTSHIEIAR